MKFLLLVIIGSLSLPALAKNSSEYTVCEEAAWDAALIACFKSVSCSGSTGAIDWTAQSNYGPYERGATEFGKDTISVDVPVKGSTHEYADAISHFVVKIEPQTDPRACNVNEVYFNYGTGNRDQDLYKKIAAKVIVLKND